MKITSQIISFYLNFFRKNREQGKIQVRQASPLQDYSLNVVQPVNTLINLVLLAHEFMVIHYLFLEH